MEKKQMRELIAKAKTAKTRSYSPYSGFSVGAALLCDDGDVILGCNIENAAFSPTCCAERVAIFSALSSGKRSFSAIAVVGDSSPCLPCGVCRQVMSEFCQKEMPVICEDENGEPLAFSLGELLPHSFDLEK